jgi:hypothetical protein
VQASLGAAQAEYRGMQLVLVNSRHQRVQRAEITGFQFQAINRGFHSALGSCGPLLEASIADEGGSLPLVLGRKAEAGPT